MPLTCEGRYGQVWRRKGEQTRERNKSEHEWSQIIAVQAGINYNNETKVKTRRTTIKNDSKNSEARRRKSEKPRRKSLYERRITLKEFHTPVTNLLIDKWKFSSLLDELVTLILDRKICTSLVKMKTVYLYFILSYALGPIMNFQNCTSSKSTFYK